MFRRTSRASPHIPHHPHRRDKESGFPRSLAGAPRSMSLPLHLTIGGKVLRMFRSGVTCPTWGALRALLVELSNGGPPNGVNLPDFRHFSPRVLQLFCPPPPLGRGIGNIFCIYVVTNFYQHSPNPNGCCTLEKKKLVTKVGNSARAKNPMFLLMFYPCF